MNKVKSVFKINSIRILKLFEVVQYSIISFIISFVLANLYNFYIDKRLDLEDSYLEYFLNIMRSLIFIIIVNYLIRKSFPFIPYIFRNFNKKYISNFKNERLTGI